MTEQPAEAPLFPVYAVHCFYQRWCQHTVRDMDPAQASKLMEEHYEQKHYGKHHDTVVEEVNEKWKAWHE